MKNLHVQYLMPLMIVTVYAASLRNEEQRILLERIRHGAEKWTSRLKTGENIRVRMITEDTSKCPKRVFCLAEAVLKESNETKTKYPQASDFLTRHLHQYNEKNNFTCHLKTSGKYHLQDFLEKVRECANYTLDQY